MLWFEEALLFHFRGIYCVVIIWGRKTAQETSQGALRSLLGNRSILRAHIPAPNDSWATWGWGSSELLSLPCWSHVFPLLSSQESPGDVGEHSQEKCWISTGMVLDSPNSPLELLEVQESWFAARQSPIISIFPPWSLLYWINSSLTQCGVQCPEQHSEM